MARVDLLGPVFWYEALTASRRGRHFLLRSAYAAVLLVALASNYQAYEQLSDGSLATSANLAATFFETFSILQICVVMLVAPAMVAGAIAQERERRTIEYLLVSQLSSVEIVVGKLGARLALMTYLLLAGIPVLSIAVLMGGIAPDSLWRVFLATVSALVMVGGLSIWASATSKKTSSAVRKAYALVLLASFGLPVVLFTLALLIMSLFASLIAMFAPPRWALAVNPFATLIWAIEPDAMSFGSTLEVAVAIQFGVGAIAIAAAANSIRASYSRDVETAGLPVAPELIVAAFAGSPVAESSIDPKSEGAANPIASTRAARVADARSHSLDRNPILWKETRRYHTIRGIARSMDDIESAVVAIASFVHSAFWIIVLMILVTNGRRNLEDLTDVSLGISGLFIAAGLLIVLVRSATTVTSEKDRDCWTSLLATPLDGREIVRGKLRAAMKTGGVCALCAAPFWLIPILFYPSLFLPFVATCLNAAILLFFAALLGFSISLRAKNSTRATVGALSIAALLCGGYLLIFQPTFAALHGRGESEYVFAVCIPYLATAPAMAWHEMRHWGDAAFEMVASFILGTGVYALATSLLYRRLMLKFDALAGRIDASVARPSLRSECARDPS